MPCSKKKKNKKKDELLKMYEQFVDKKTIKEILKLDKSNLRILLKK